ncbi:MAG: ectoine/hydroxyectoine ABC transporter ATP-binding protein EhuA [Proteobacteria bacterium]|nr:ectoine/hydroxyectoine ABC transporter ATP-binding protein EhuA [Pseudomonadota bacterium]
MPEPIAAQPKVRLDRVTKRYGDLVVLDQLSMDVAPNEMISIIGPSGSGKTTILRLLMTLEQVTDGIISIDGEPLTHMPKNGGLAPANRAHLRRMRTKIGMCFQHFNLFPHMTALQNCIEGPIQVLGMSKVEATARAMDLLAMVGLEEKAGEHPVRLSGGQKQRVAIARALAMRPEVLLLDEVTSALDPEVIGEVLQVIRGLNKKYDLTILMVTHQMGFAKEISDRVVFIYEGKVEEAGAPDQIFGDPTSERTRQFLSAVLEAG